MTREPNAMYFNAKRSNEIKLVGKYSHPASINIGGISRKGRTRLKYLLKLQGKKNFKIY
jgi:hypothetical protein